MHNLQIAFAWTLCAATCCGADSPYGVCAHVTMRERGDARRVFEDVARSGIGFVRTDFRFWMVRERETDAEDWTLFDGTLRGAGRRGLQILPILWKLPGFQRPILSHREAWRGWVRRVAERYGNEVSAVEIGNEPNVPGFWSEKVFRMSDYVALLQDAYAEIKSVRPQVRVSCAGWSGIPLDVISEFYACGGGKCCDIVSVHPYCDHEYENRPEGFLDVGLESLRALMKKNGDAAKPIWITEIGWPTHRQTLGGASVVAHGLGIADPERHSWRILVVGRSPDDGGPDDTYAALLGEVLPSGSAVESVVPERLSERLSRGDVDAVVFATGKEFHREAFPAFREFVANGGIGVVLAHQAMRDEMERRADGSIGVATNAGWGIAERAALHFEFLAPWHDKTRKMPHRLRVHSVGEASNATNMVAKSFIGKGFLKGGDSFIPIVEGECEGRTYYAAGLYVFNSELKGKLLVSTLHDPFFRASSEGRQAKMLARSMGIAFAEGVEKIFWYAFSDVDASDEDPQSRFGIVHEDGRPKPAVRAYETFVKMRPPGSMNVPAKWHNETRTAYFPKWRCPDGRKAGMVWTIGRRREVTFPFGSSEIAFFNIYGDAVKPITADGGCIVPVSDSPVYFMEILRAGQNRGKGR